MKVPFLAVRAVFLVWAGWCWGGCQGGGVDGKPAGSPAACPASATPAGVPTQAQAAERMDSFPLSTCPMCGAQLGSRGEAIEFSHQGRQLRLCSSRCRAEFERDPAAGIARIDSVLIADQLPYYPLARSLFNDRPLPPHPIDFIWGNRLFRAVDSAEHDRILADPISAIEALDRAVIQAQRPTYGMPDKCPVQGDILPNEARIDIVVANRMIRVCCGRCVRVVRSRPYQYLAMVEYANRSAAEARAREAEEDSGLAR